MKIFPIKVEPSSPRPYKIVEWMLHNVCNYDCSFCPSSTKNGSKRWFDLQVYKDTCERAIKEANKPVWFKLTGGEPTLYPKLKELLNFIKQLGGFTYIISNGSRTIRYWKEIKAKNTLDFLALSVHPEQTSDYQHIIDVINLFRFTPTVVTVNVTCIPSFFDEAVRACDLILENCATIVNLQQVNDVRGMAKYTDEQVAILNRYTMVRGKTMAFQQGSTVPKELSYHSGKVKFTYNDESVVENYAHIFIKNGETNFKDWTCDIGKNLIRIEHDVISRAVCGQGEKWTIYDGPLFASTPLVCQYDGQCSCTLDVIEPKVR